MVRYTHRSTTDRLDNTKEEMIQMSKVMTPAEFAVEVDSDGRTVRKFLRATMPKESHPGKGARWSLPGTAREVTKLKKQFNEWHTSQDEARAAREAAKAEAATPEVDEVEDDELADA